MGRALVCRLASLGHDLPAMVRDVQAPSRRPPCGIVLRVAALHIAVIRGCLSHAACEQGYLLPNTLIGLPLMHFRP
jgi:hypothetical protein